MVIYYEIPFITFGTGIFYIIDGWMKLCMNKRISIIRFSANFLIEEVDSRNENECRDRG